jgi:hypothetical protein
MIKLFSSKKATALFIISLITALFFVACKKNDVETGPVTPPATPPDLTTTITSSVSGFVTDENNAPAKSTTVQIGTATVATDKYGYFEARNVTVVKEAAVVTINKAGYFKSIKTYVATAGKSAFVRIKLIPKLNNGSVNGAAGGAVTLNNGLSITFTANSIVNASTNAVYTGTVNVAASFINPTSADLNSIMPGDLRGLNTEGNLQLLTTYGMAAVELTGSGGELLQVAAGKKAILSLPVPSALQATAPSTIPLWYFDETKGLWKQEGSATKNGSNYVGEVSHFSFWNYDVPANYVQFNCTVVNTNNQPLKNALVKISVAASPYNARYSYTDSAGDVSGLIPANSNLLLEILSDCKTTVYSQTFIAAAANISLGTITITNTNFQVNISGTATNCANTPITNGHVIFFLNQQYYSYPLANGVFNFNSIVCAIPTSVSIVVTDRISNLQSTPASYILNAGNNNIGNIKACGINTEEFVEITGSSTYNGGYTRNVKYSPLNQGVYFYTSQNSGRIRIETGDFLPSTFIEIDNLGIGPNSLQRLNYIDVSPIDFPLPGADQTLPGSMVTITEYGAIGEYIAGNFTCVNQAISSPNELLNLSCSFRVRRTF